MNLIITNGTNDAREASFRSTLGQRSIEKMSFLNMVLDRAEGSIKKANPNSYKLSGMRSVICKTKNRPVKKKEKLDFSVVLFV